MRVAEHSAKYRRPLEQDVPIVRLTLALQFALFIHRPQNREVGIGMQGQNPHNLAAWVETGGPSNDIAISTRARLARNVQWSPFPNKARDADLKRVADVVLAAVGDAGPEVGRLRIVDPAHLSESERLALVNAHLASRQQVRSGRYRPVAIGEDGALSMMVNEEDHLRIQCILPGFQPMEALETAQKLDNYLGSKIGYAKTDNYGYLTTSLANIGTGLRLSVMLHLAGLAFLGEAVSVLTAAAELKISVRGLFGEGTKAVGDIFQVSNETTIGFSEREITSRVRAAAEHLISREREARDRLASERRDELAELVDQAAARLMESTALSGRDAMACLSILRLGTEAQLKRTLSPMIFNELLASMQLEASASDESARKTGSLGNDIKRAKIVREKLAEFLADE